VVVTERARGGPSGQQRRRRVYGGARVIIDGSGGGVVVAAATGRPNDRSLEGGVGSSGGSPFSHTPRVVAYSVCWFRVVFIITELLFILVARDAFDLFVSVGFSSRVRRGVVRVCRADTSNGCF